MKNDAGGQETVVRLFDLASGKPQPEFRQGADESFFNLCFSPNGKVLACGFSDRSRLLDVTSGRVLLRLPERAVALAFSPDSQKLVASIGHRIRLFDVATGKEYHDRPGDFGYTPVTAATADGRLLASGDWIDRKVTLWDSSNGRLLRSFPLRGDGRYVRNLAFSSNGRTLVAAEMSGFLQFWDVTTGTEQRVVRLRNSGNKNTDFYQLHVSAGGRRVATLERMFGRTGSFTRLATWETTGGTLLGEHSLPDRVYERQCVWFADGSAVALPLNDGLKLLDVARGTPRFQIAGTSPGGPVALSADDRLIAAARAPAKHSGPGKDQQASVGVWETAAGNEVAALGTGRVSFLGLVRGNRFLVTVDERFLRLWDLATAQERRRWPLPHAGTDIWGDISVRRMQLLPRCQVFTALSDGSGLVWDLTEALTSTPALINNPGQRELAAWWADLASTDARRAYTAVWRLADAAASTTFIRERLKPAVEADFDVIRMHIAGLDSNSFQDRQKAYKALEMLGDAADPGIRQALTKSPSLEVRRRLETLLSRSPLNRSPETLRRLRAIQVLELLATENARRLLTELANGFAFAVETKQAKASLERLSPRLP